MDPIASFLMSEQRPVLPILARFLTPLPPALITACLSAYTEPGDLVVNPFCHSPMVAVEADRLGRRAVLADANPLTVFVVRTLLSLPPEREIVPAFHRLSESFKGETTLRAHLRQLYRTTCPRCQQPAVVSHFVWSRQTGRPVEKSFTCAACHQDRVEPVDDADLETQAGFEERGFHYWAVVDRLSHTDGELRSLSQRLVGLYTPRNLYALSTLASKAESVVESPALLNAFRLALVECLDRCSKLTPAHRRAPSRVALRPPSEFLELNVWDTFEQVVEELVSYGSTETADRPWPSLTDSVLRVAGSERGGRSAVAEGAPVAVVRLSAYRVGDELPASSVDLVLGEAPPLQAGNYLPLSFMWTGWVLGREAASAFNPETLTTPVRHDDWDRYLHSMAGALSGLARALAPGGRAVLFYEEADLGRVRSLVMALAAAGLRLMDLEYQPVPGASPSRAGAFGGTAGRYMLVARKSLEPQSPRPALALDAVTAQIRGGALQAARDTLSVRAQPSPFIWINNAVCRRLSEAGVVADLWRSAGVATSPLACLDDEMRAAMEQGLKRDLVQITGADEQAVDVAADGDSDGDEDAPAATRASGVTWWLARPKPGLTPLCDRVEETVYRLLGLSTSFTADEVGRAVYSSFHASEAPEPGLVNAIIESYSRTLAGGERWLSPDDQPVARQQEHLGMLVLLTELGHELGMKVWIARGEQKRDTPAGLLYGLLSVDERYRGPGVARSQKDRAAEIDVVWSAEGQDTMLFEVEWSACLQAALVDRRVTGPGLRRFLVVPEERVDLIQFKLARSPLWQQAVVQDGWEFIKFSHLRRFAAEQPNLERLAEIVGLNPSLERHGVQLRLL